MNSVNVNIPMVNLPQVAHLQSEVHRAPMVHQAQNADMARDRLDLQMRTARETEEAEGKTVDPNARKEDDRKNKKKKKQDGQDEENGQDGNDTEAPAPVLTLGDSGRLIDLEA